MWGDNCTGPGPRWIRRSAPLKCPKCPQKDTKQQFYVSVLWACCLLISPWSHLCQYSPDQQVNTGDQSFFNLKQKLQLSQVWAVKDLNTTMTIKMWREQDVAEWTVDVCVSVLLWGQRSSVWGVPADWTRAATASCLNRSFPLNVIKTQTSEIDIKPCFSLTLCSFISFQVSLWSFSWKLPPLQVNKYLWLSAAH